MVRKGVVVSVVVIFVVVVILLGFYWGDDIEDGDYEWNMSEEKIREINEDVAKRREEMYSAVELLKDGEIPSEEELEISLPMGKYYPDGENIDGMRKLIVECDNCDKREECNFVCTEECSSNNMNFKDVFPIRGIGLEKEGECSCLCGFPSHINDFRIVQAVKNKDADECEKIEVDTENFFVKRYDCYMVSAMFLQDESVCEKIVSNDIMKSGCYSNVAIIKKDVALCSNVFVESFLWSESLCNEYVSEGRDPYFAIPE